MGTSIISQFRTRVTGTYKKIKSRAHSKRQVDLMDVMSGRAWQVKKKPVKKKRKKSKYIYVKVKR